MSKRDLLRRLNELEHEFATTKDVARIPQIHQEIQEMRQQLARAGSGPEIELWLLLFSVLAIVIGFVVAGGLGVAVTFCPLAAFWIVGYGLVWRIILDK